VYGKPNGNSRTETTINTGSPHSYKNMQMVFFRDSQQERPGIIRTEQEPVKMYDTTIEREFQLRGHPFNSK
jgi:hypothetical protein